MPKRKLADDDFWDAIVGNETGSSPDKRCPHCGSNRMTFESHICQSCGKDERTPAVRAKPALTPAVRKQQADLAQSLLDMDARSGLEEDDDLIC